MSPRAGNQKVSFIRHRSAYKPALRLVVALLGGYAFTWGLVAFGVATLAGLGMDYHDAETAWMVLAFLIFLPLFLWSFASPHQGRVMALLCGGAALMTVAAGAVQLAVLA